MLDLLEDRRIDCTSIMTSMSVGEYLALVDHVYANRGGIEGQRAPLKTKTALTIRKRLVHDLQVGAVVPPIVIGALVTRGERAALRELQSSQELPTFFRNLEVDKLSIIDGMQRTTALKEAIQANGEMANEKVRVEFWATEYINSLIYRMLVLNTGQVPWELARQLETVYSQFLQRISDELGKDNVEIFSRDDLRRRANAAQYQGHAIVELLLVFSSRKPEVEVKDKVAEDFARLDIIETSAHANFIGDFVEMLRLLSRLDRAFSRLGKDPEAQPTRLSSGKDIFGSFPAMAGFAAAVAIAIYDEPGFSIDWDTTAEKLVRIAQATNAISARLEALTEAELREFLQLELLQERMTGRRGGVGRYERELFRKAFTAMLNNADRLESMQPCWLAG